jgi:hypothetical protein
MYSHFQFEKKLGEISWIEKRLLVFKFQQYFLGVKICQIFNQKYWENVFFSTINSSNFAKILISQKLKKQNLGGVSLKGGGLSSSIWNHTNGI